MTEKNTSVESDDVNSLEKKKKNDAIERFNRLHSAIFGDISYILKTANLTPMDVLQSHDPHFMIMVDRLILLKSILEPLSNFLPTVVTGAVIARLEEYIDLAKNIAEAIESGCTDSLGAAIAALDEKPYV